MFVKAITRTRKRQVVNDNQAQAIVDGWYNTGDIGTWDEQGRLIIINRSKSIFKLSHGEYISPEK
jgi:long-chain acyl-CoA synthetase